MNIEMKVSLKGFDKEINRIIAVNDDMALKKFCEAVIESMNGWLEHLYILTHNKIEYMSSGFDARDFDAVSIGTKKLSYLELQEKDKLLLEYDTGDGWEFKIQVKKVNNGYKEKNFTILSGKGKGIIENCGGLWGLEQFINKTVPGEMQDWYLSLFEEDELYDINDFDLEETNHYLDSVYNKRKKKIEVK